MTPSQVNVAFSRETPPSLEDIQQVINVIGGRSGCSGCGIAGIDLRLQLVDEVIAHESKIPVSITVQNRFL